MKNKKDVKINFIGKIAHVKSDLSDEIKPMHAYRFFENIKTRRDKLWYIMIENNNDLSIIKYNIGAGIKLDEFTKALKGYYIKQYQQLPPIKKIIEQIEISGEDRFIVLKNIPNIEIGGINFLKTIISDLTKLLAEDLQNGTN